MGGKPPLDSSSWVQHLPKLACGPTCCSGSLLHWQRNAANARAEQAEAGGGSLGSCKDRAAPRRAAPPRRAA